MRCIPIFIVQLCFYEIVLSAFQFGFISAMAGRFIGLNPFSLWLIIATPLGSLEYSVCALFLGPVLF